jgi:hypothetical protein
MVHGAPRKSSTQGLVERCNMDVENIILTYQSEHQTSDWADKLHRFQAMKNNRFHRGIGMTPFEALYGRKIASLPANCSSIEVEESHPLPTAKEPNFEVSDEELSEDENRELLDISHATIQTNLVTAREKQQKQADGMLKSTAMRYSEVAIGTTVRVPVPEMDRSKVDPRNVLAVVMEQNNGNIIMKYILMTDLIIKQIIGYYKLGTAEGVLPQMYIRTSFEPCASNHLSFDDVPASSSTTLRNAAAANSQSGGQGFFFCGCAGEKKKCSQNAVPSTRRIPTRRIPSRRKLTRRPPNSPHSQLTEFPTRRTPNSPNSQLTED